MPACDPNSPPWCNAALLHEPNSSDLQLLTIDQISQFLDIAETAARLVRDGISFYDTLNKFGKLSHSNDQKNQRTYSREDLPGVYFVLSFVCSENGNSDTVDQISIHTMRRLVGIKKHELEQRLELRRSSTYVPPGLDDRRSDIDFSYEIGRDAGSCFPGLVYLNYFKDEAYWTGDPRAEQEAKYLGRILIERAYMTPAEKAERARRVPQCRSRQPTPRSGLWQPSIPHDAPYAAYFKKQEAVSYRVKKGDPMIAVGLDAPNEARVLWTWVGE